MSSKREQIPLYAADGTSLGFRTIEAAKRLIAGGYVKPAYGRKGHLKAIWLLQQDGGNPVETIRIEWHAIQLPAEPGSGAVAGSFAGWMGETTMACR